MNRNYQRLLRSVGAYRMVIGQPRQKELLRYLRNRDIDGAEFAIDLSPRRALD